MSISPTAVSAASQGRHRLVWALAIVGLFVFRLLYGLSREFFFEDETQIFLMGLRHYATGAWPYFGPDVVWTKSEIPGALQALLISLPLKLVAAPEAPFVLLNVLSFGALAAFAAYIKARIPSMPSWLVWGWLMTVPWTLEFSTHIINPSYVLAPAIVFFLGFFETVPAFRIGKIAPPLAFAMMGASLVWILQIHMSWPLLLPYVAFAWLSRWHEGPRRLAIDAASFMCGAMAVGTVLLPTLFAHGLHGGTGGTLSNLHPHFVNPSVALDTLARLFSFPSLEIWRFMATDDGKREMFLLRHLWLAPVALVVWFTGIWQPFWMLREWFRTRSDFAEWRPLKYLVAVTVVLVYASYWFVMEPSQAHAFYAVSPIAFLFAAYCWTFVDSPRWRRIAAVLLGLNILFHVGQAWIQAPEISLYRNREVVAAAVRLKEPEMFAHRRAFAIDGGPISLQDPSRPYNAVDEVKFSNVSLRMGPRRVALWTLTLQNTNPRVAFRDVLYQAHYRDANGQVVVERHDFIKQIFQPGETLTLEVNDGFITRPFASATIHVLAAEALIPMP
ncbi:MAG: hypothetical protein ABMA15_12925 [Vicinamibacterales bacterium]